MDLLSLLSLPIVTDPQALITALVSDQLKKISIPSTSLSPQAILAQVTLKMADLNRNIDKHIGDAVKAHLEAKTGGSIDDHVEKMFKAHVAAEVAKSAGEPPLVTPPIEVTTPSKEAGVASATDGGVTPLTHATWLQQTTALFGSAANTITDINIQRTACNSAVKDFNTSTDAGDDYSTRMEKRAAVVSLYGKANALVFRLTAIVKQTVALKTLAINSGFYDDTAKAEYAALRNGLPEIQHRLVLCTEGVYVSGQDTYVPG